MDASHAVPFRIVRGDSRRQEGVTAYVITETVEDGLARLEGDALVLQVRVTRTVTRSGMRGIEQTTESEPLREHRIPLAAIRTARLARRWWRPRLEISAGDLRAFEGAPGLSRDRLLLPVPRAERAEAADLAATLSLRAAERMLEPPAAPAALPPTSPS